MFQIIEYIVLVLVTIALAIFSIGAYFINYEESRENNLIEAQNR